MKQTCVSIAVRRLRNPTYQLQMPNGGWYVIFCTQKMIAKHIFYAIYTSRNFSRQNMFFIKNTRTLRWTLWSPDPTMPPIQAHTSACCSVQARRAHESSPTNKEDIASSPRMWVQNKMYSVTKNLRKLLPPFTAKFWIVCFPACDLFTENNTSNALDGFYWHNTGHDLCIWIVWHAIRSKFTLILGCRGRKRTLLANFSLCHRSVARQRSGREKPTVTGNTITPLVVNGQSDSPETSHAVTRCFVITWQNRSFARSAIHTACRVARVGPKPICTHHAARPRWRVEHSRHTRLTCRVY